MANTEAAQIPMMAAVDNFFLESSVRQRKKTESLRRFQSNEKFRFEFLEIPATMEQHVPESTEKGTTSRDVSKFWEISHRELPFHLTFLPEFSAFSVEWFAFRKCDNFRIF